MNTPGPIDLITPGRPLDLGESGDQPFYFFQYIYERFFGESIDLFIDKVIYIYSLYSIVAIFLVLIFLVGIIYCHVRLHQIRKEELYKLKNPSVPFNSKNVAVGAAEEKEGEPKGRLRWGVVERHIESTNPNDWRLAILEADILLDNLCKEKGFLGENLGERLKGVDPSDFRSIDKAWEAHRVRNAIAHEGGDFMLNQREARRVVSLFREVFEEFNYI